MAEPTYSGHVSPAIDAEREALLKTLVAHNVQFVVGGSQIVGAVGLLGQNVFLLGDV